MIALTVDISELNSLVPDNKLLPLKHTTSTLTILFYMGFEPCPKVHNLHSSRIPSWVPSGTKCSIYHK